MTFDVQYFKSQFPLFDHPDNQTLAYLDNAATTQKPQCVIDAITYFYTHQNGNAQRASHRLSRSATDMVAVTRKLAAEFLGVSHSQSIAFTSGATQALNAVAFGVEAMIGGGATIVISHQEHHANLLPWQRLAQRTNERLLFFPECKGRVDWSAWRTVVTEHTRLIVFTLASNVSGDCLDVSIIRDIKSSFPQVMTVLDASQWVAHKPLMAEEWGCDFLVCSAHKFYGPTGIGLLYINPLLIEKLNPILVGGEMVDSVSAESSVFHQGIQRLEAGTAPLSAIAGLGACLRFWQQQDRQLMAVYEQGLTAYLHQQLDGCFQSLDGDDWQLLSSAENNIGIAMVITTNKMVALSDMAAWLDEANIAVRVGEHCAQLQWQSFARHYGASQGLRISLAAYNTKADIDCLVEQMRAFIAALESSGGQDSTAEWLSETQWQQLHSASSWQKRYTLLLRIGKALTVHSNIRSDDYLVKGCESLVWLKHEERASKHYFVIDSDSALMKGLGALLLYVLDGRTANEVVNTDIEQLYHSLDLQKHLSASRMNGFQRIAAMCQQAVEPMN